MPRGGNPHDALAQRPRGGARRPPGRGRRRGAGRGEHPVQRHARHRLRRAGARRLRGGTGVRGDLHGRARIRRLRAAGPRRPLAARRHGGHRPPRRRVPGRAVCGVEGRPRGLLRDGQRAGARADPRRGPLRRPRLGRAGERGGAVPGDPRHTAGGGRRLHRAARGRGSGCPDPRDGADREHRGRRADRRPRGRDGAAQAPRARLRRATRARRLRQLSAAARRWRRHGGDRPHQRRRALWRPGPPHGRGRRRRRRRAARARRAPSGLGVVGLRRAVRQGPEGRGVRLLQDRPAPLQPRADQAHERRERPQLRGGRGRPRGAGALVLGLTVAILGSSGGWHAQQLTDALAARGHEHRVLPVTRMLGRIDGDVALRSRDVWLDDCDAVIVRGIPRGSLEQVIFRVDALHALQARGVTCVNGPRALERTIDKFLASALLARARVSTPRTVACERADDALEAFEELGGDVIVKPLFGAMGAGMTRVDDADVAYRVFHALELERAVYYLQETLPHDGRDLRALVVGGRVLAAIERIGSGWRANLARGARAQATRLSDDQERLCLEAAEVLGVDYAGVDVLRAADGRDYVLELNGIPGWRGLQEATGAVVAAALVAHLETLVSAARPARAGR